MKKFRTFEFVAALLLLALGLRNSSMLLTGVDDHRNGVGAMKDLMPEQFWGKPGCLGYLGNNAVTVARLLKDRDYRTSVAGKWHLGHAPETLPPNRGFEILYSGQREFG